MKKLVFASLLGLISISLFAQKEHDQKRGDRIAEELDLTSQQQDQLKIIGERNRALVKSIRNSEMTKQEKRETMKRQHEANRAEVSQILTAPQLEKWDEMHAGRKERRQKKRSAMKELNLSENQKKELKLIHEEHRTAMKSIKNSDVSDEEMKAGRNALKAQSQAELARVLSPEQLEKFNEIKRQSRTKHGGGKRHSR